MRALKRLLIFWAISAPLFYFLGIPLALDHLSKKAQTQGYEQCVNHMKDEGMMGSANSPITAEQAVGYCHCVSDSLTFTKKDLFDMVQHQPPAALTATQQTLAEKCNADLQRAQGFLPPAGQQPAETNLSDPAAERF